MLRGWSLPGAARQSLQGASRRLTSVSEPLLLTALQRHHQEAAKREVAWFVKNMPPAYFRQVAGRSQEMHLRAITALSGSAIAAPEIRLTDDDGSAREVTYLSATTGGGARAVSRQLFQDVKPGTELRRVLLFTSKDARLSLNVFEVSSDVRAEPRFGDGANVANELTADYEAAAFGALQAYVAQLEAGAFAGEALARHALPPELDGLTWEQLDAFLRKCTSRYVRTQLPRLLFRQMGLYQRVVGGESAAIDIEHDYKPDDKMEELGGAALLTLAVPGVPTRQTLGRALSVLTLHDADLLRAQVDVIAGETESAAADVTLLRTVIKSTAATATAGGEAKPLDYAALERDLLRIKWMDDRVLDLAVNAEGGLTLPEAEVATGLAALSLAVLDHPLLSASTIHDRLLHPEALPHAAALAKLFLSRFDPASPIPDAIFDQQRHDLLSAVDTSVRDDETRTLLRTMDAAAAATVRTNVHVDSRWALAMRLDPTFFASALPPSPQLSNMPFGVFFLAGRHFEGYHVRFTDIARGGLRVVAPATAEAHVVESRRHFNECFSLAWAQQLKNKDIPEGGSKAVCLVRPVAHAASGKARAELLHACVKRFTDSALDLLVPSDVVVTPSALAPSGEYVAPPPELLFLGPDENITPTDIDWIVDNAAKRDYALPSAFMSSKPLTGINHKEFGVTSEGVAVFLAEALRSVGIEPARDKWSIKLTGGPDGDVAGNMLKILNRDYPDTATVVGMADGTGCAEDPNGLPMAELLTLFERGEGLASLNPSSLSPTAELTLADTPAGAARRNTMHNRVVADAFVPAGGRPATIHGNNWKDFLVDGVSGAAPSSKVIVEGANLFLTPDARLGLFDRCSLPVVKDSSANKCGVICSSMEIVASMTLSDDEFLELKPTYVSEVLDRLRELARQEATLLFAEAATCPAEPLPSISERISHAILRAEKALGGLLSEMGHEQRTRLWPIVHSQLPPSLVARHAARLPELLPWEYQRSMIASGLASRLVYREGLSFVEGLSDERLPAFALQYLQQEEVVRTLAKQVAEHDAPWASQVEALLLRGGVRTAAEQADAAPRASK